MTSQTTLKFLSLVLVLAVVLALSRANQNDLPEKTVATILTAACKKFRNKDVGHADFYDDMVDAYSGPDVSRLVLPYGVPKNDFKFAHEIGELYLWRQSLSPLSKKYGERRVNDLENRQWYESILNYELPVSIIGPNYQSTSSNIF